MRRFSFLLLLLAGVAGAQVWEKPIAPGLVYRMEIDTAIPRVIHALRFTPGSPTKAMTDLAGHTVYAETAAKGCETVSQMVAEQGAIAGINASFFPYTGDPIGSMVRSGELVSTPAVNRACFGWTNEIGSGAFGFASFQGYCEVAGTSIQIDNVDGECPQNGITLNTETTAFSLAKSPNVHVFIRIDKADFSPNGTSTGVVQNMTADEVSVAVPKGFAVLVAQGNKIGQVTSLRPNDRVTIRFQSGGFDFSKIDQLVSAGPFLVRNGSIAPDADIERFRDDFTKQRHPRSAVGKTAAGDVWFVAVDGRQPTSDGATIAELAEVMLKLGCRDAINLDGGGSTDMNILGVTINRPSDGFERPVCNGIFFFGPKQPKSQIAVVIDGPATLDMNGTLTLHAVEGDKPVPDADVLWSAQGGAWIDQGGLLKPVKPGIATVSAWVHGQIVTKQIMVTGIPPKPRAKPASSRAGDRGGRKTGGG